VIAFVQGAAVGAMIMGIPVSNGQYSGGAFGWFAAFPIMTGTGLVLGYALLGAGWLVLKSEGTLHDWARRRIPWLAAAVLVVMFVAFGATANLNPLARGNLHARPWGIACTAIGVFALVGVIAGSRSKRDGFPFAMTVLFFLSAFLALGAMFWPYIIPYQITVGSAAAPDASLSFLFYGAALILPLITLYTMRVYWIFRGKICRDHG